MPKGEEGKLALALSGVSVISVTDRSFTSGRSPNSSTDSFAPISGSAAEAAAALRAKGSSQEGILISSESSKELDGRTKLLGASGGAGATGAACVGFACSKVSELGTLDAEDGVALKEAGAEFVAPGRGAGVWLEEFREPDSTGSARRGEAGIAGFVSG